MPFIKNDKNINTKGRSTGVLNKSTRELKEILQQVQLNNLDFIKTHINTLTMKERLQLNKDLLSFLLPKYTSEIPPIQTHEQIIKEYELNNTLKTLSVDELKQLIENADFD